MKLTKQQKRERRNKLLFKTAIIALSTLFIVYFMPRGEGFNYSYKLNEPWVYGQLIAQFKFPILKSDSVLNHETDSVMRYFQPYYNIDNSKTIRMQQLLANTVAEEWKGKDIDKYTRHINNLLDTIYSHGVLTIEEYEQIRKNGFKNIRIIKENNATLRPLSSLYTTKTAYEYIMQSDTTIYSHNVLQDLNIQNYIEANTQIDEIKTQSAKADLLTIVNAALGEVHAGQKIIDHGELVTKDIYNILESMKKASTQMKAEDNIINYRIAEQAWFVMLLFSILVTYMSLFRADYFDKIRSAVLPFTLVVVFTIISTILISLNQDLAYLIPLCMVPIVIRVFMDSRTAFMFHCAMVIIISQAVVDKEMFIIMALVAGMIAIQTLRELSERSQIIKTAALITLIQYALYTVKHLETASDFSNLSILFDTRAQYIIINGVLLLFTYPMLYVFEKIFGFVSDVTLVELSSISNPLLQRMSEIAPGTFQHSMQVANLSSEVAKKIKAKPQLVRTGALYHDIGKLERPVFFTENQAGGNPHKHLTSLKSAEVIIAHVNNGLALADRHHLPEEIKSFIRSHHGIGKAKYFYITYKNEHPDEVIDENLFTYPGPNPSSKEEAILMMVDSVEAASRSLPEYTEESISNLVENIINGQVADGFFTECDITFKDIAVAKSVLKEKLKTIYHTRISYPELSNNTKEGSQN